MSTAKAISDEEMYAKLATCSSTRWSSSPTAPGPIILITMRSSGNTVGAT